MLGTPPASSRVELEPNKSKLTVDALKTIYQGDVS